MVSLGGFCMLMLCLIVHEYGHYRAMKKYKIKVAEVGLGIPVPTIPFISYRTAKGLKLTLHPLLLGAYVKPTLKDAFRIGRLPYIAQAEINGAGIWANLIFACLLLSLALLLGVGVQPGILAIGVTLLVMLLKKIFYWVLPVLIAATFVLFTYLLFFSGDPHVGGPLAIAGLYRGKTNFLAFFGLSAIISLSLAIVNLFPASVLDGGHIMGYFLRRYFGEAIVAAFNIAGALFVLILMLWGVGSDVLSLLR